MASIESDAKTKVEKGRKGQREFTGFTGTSIYGGYFSEETLTRWDETDALNTFEKMRRSDSQIKMVLRAIKNPILSAKFAHIADGDDAKTEDMVNFLDWVWFDSPLLDFGQWLGEALTFLDFGFSVHEKKFSLYEHKDFGPVHVLGGLGFRKQLSIESWDVRGRKGLKGVRQLAMGDTTGGDTGDVFIPIEKLSLLSHEREGDNYEGVSMLRPCYGAWLRKNLYLKLLAIGIEKAAIGTPIGKYPRGAENSADKDAFKNTLSNFALHESSFIMMPQNYEVELVKIPFDADKIMAAIGYEDVQMSKTILFQFLELGTNSSSGSYALGADMSDFALASLQFIGDYIAKAMDAINVDLIRWNFGDSDNMPRCKCSGINQKAGKELSEIIEKLVSTQVIRPDDRLEAHARELYNLPQAETTREDDELEAEKKAKANPPAPVPAQPGAPAPKVGDAKPGDEPPEPVEDDDDKVAPPDKKLAEIEGAYFRALTEYERPLDLAEIASTMDTEKEKLLSFMKNEIAAIKDRALRGVAALLKRYTGDDKSRAADEFNLPTKKYEVALTRQYIQQAQAGMKTARKDLTAKLSEYAMADSDVLQYLPDHVKKALKLQAKYQAATHGQEIERIITTGVMSGVENEFDDAAIIEQISADLDAYVESNKIATAAGTSTAQNISRGRSAWFFDKENIKQIQAFQYSAILDSKTTDICLSLDGKIVRPHDPALARLRPPNHHNCRSILIPITVNETKPKVTGIQVDPTNDSLTSEYKKRGKPVPSMEKINKSRGL